ncbi:hypothetical protein B0H14DRAFT_3437805 [Mycena olivaceomarginata]|nr:hypothetical protein B0H14DRAFT_3437805 [Mycena olivaceomarginata]
MQPLATGRCRGEYYSFHPFLPLTPPPATAPSSGVPLLPIPPIPSQLPPSRSFKDATIKVDTHKITAPCLLVYGTHDELAGRQEAIEAPLTGAKSVLRKEFANSSHLPNVEEQEEYNAVLGKWLDEQD